MAAVSVSSEQGCPSRALREVAQSRTLRGHLGDDVRDLVDGRLLIADFAVGDARVKASTRQEGLLHDWLGRFECDSSYRLGIAGYSDCLGSEEANRALRSARAASVSALLDAGTRERLAYMLPAPVATFVTGNGTIEQRATNRSVVINILREIDFEPDVVVVRPPQMGRRQEPFLEVRPWQYKLIMRTFVPFRTFGDGFVGDGRSFSTGDDVTYRTGLFLVWDQMKGRIVAGPVGHSTGTLSVGGLVVGPLARVGGANQAWANVRADAATEGKPGRIWMTARLSGSMPLLPVSPNIDNELDMTAILPPGAKELEVAGYALGESFPNTEIFIRDWRGRTKSLVRYATPYGPYAPLIRIWGEPLERFGFFRRRYDVSPDGAFGP